MRLFHVFNFLKRPQVTLSCGLFCYQQLIFDKTWYNNQMKKQSLIIVLLIIILMGFGYFLVGDKPDTELFKEEPTPTPSTSPKYNTRARGPDFNNNYICHNQDDIVVPCKG